MPHEVFISYSEEDKIKADAVCHALEGKGIRCWIAPRDIKYGANWGAAIVDALDVSKVMVLIFSSSANISPHVNREVQHAFDKNITVIPFRVENVAPTKALQYYISAVQWLDAMNPPIEQHIEKLIETVRQIVPPKEEAPKPQGEVKTPPLTSIPAPSAPPPRPVQTPSRRDSTNAMTALILGIVSMIIPCVGLVCGPFAIFLSKKELKAIDTGESSPELRGYANVGMILGWIGIVVGILSLLYFLYLVVAGIAASGMRP
ncbi:MAG TPA: TIR domain-containing protein [Pyrinomonadaceae bacterium]|jgi:hypothetical protein